MFQRRLRYSTTCARCDGAMPKGTPYAIRGGRPIHTHCASGADD